jgi:hypothetical protein
MRNHLYAYGAVDMGPDGRTASGTRTTEISGSAAWLIYTIYSTERRGYCRYVYTRGPVDLDP